MLRTVTAVLLLAGTAAIAASAPVQPEQVPVDLQLRQARKDAETALAEQRRLEKTAAEARDEVTKVRAQQLAAAQAIEAAEARITAADAEALLVQAQLAAQRDRLSAQQAPVSALLGGLYLAARRPPLLLVANSGSAEDLVKLRVLVSAAAPAIRTRTASLSAELNRQGQLVQQALAARVRITETRDELRKKRAALAGLEQRAIELARERGSQALSAGDVAIASQERFIGVQQGALSEGASRKLAADLAALGPAPLAGTAPPPPPFAYELPAEDQVTEGMGAVSPNGVRSRGLRLATRRGSALIVPASGTVLFSGPFRDYDGVVIIDHGDGWKSVIVNAGSKLRKGSRVRIGEPLGTALGPIEVQLLSGGEPVSAALIAGSSQVLSNPSKGG